MENPSMYLHSPGDARMSEHPVPSIDASTDVILRMAFVGVCGSDIHFWNEGGVGGDATAIEKPFIMGHEGSGTVYEVGSSVTDLKKGDRVAIEGSFPCRFCDRCIEGCYQLCSKMKFAASGPGQDGMLTKYYKANAEMCLTLPEKISLEEGVLVEPLAVAVHAVRIVGIRPGDTVIISGSGTIGLMCGVVAKYYGAKKIIAVDINDAKLRFAEDLYDCSTYSYNTKETPQQNAQIIKDIFGLGLGADRAIEASGAESSINCDLHSLRGGGHFVQTGLGKSEIKFPMLVVAQKELHIHGDFRYGPGDFRIARDILESEMVPFRKMISRIFPFEEATAAWDETKGGKGIKNMIESPA